MKTKEIHVLFETLDTEKHLLKYDCSHEVEYTANEPSYINFIRIIDGDWTITKDVNQTVLDFKDTELRIHWMNAEPEYIVVKEKVNADGVGEYNGSIIDLLKEYKIPMTPREWVGYSMTLTRVAMNLRPCEMRCTE
ncbi:hypothetical protein ACLHZ0_21900 [Aeromonas salmonicida]|uniref:hypothetical protein n=1 Tax=Aeromonas salmonicida TaxID=645 RepID=UPI0029A63461|nr:hypothetical protein [Aeromonas salmonicida]HEH9421174.1 hypothetical protein [Aeromonas salmonicida]HEH9436657.1 hypothetical protein [Aeromonas salmonicida]